MPQFDFYCFSGQTFWFLLFYSFIYYVTIYLYVSNFSELIKNRSKLTNRLGPVTFFFEKYKPTSTHMLNRIHLFCASL